LGHYHLPEGGRTYRVNPVSRERLVYVRIRAIYDQVKKLHLTGLTPKDFIQNIFRENGLAAEGSDWIGHSAEPYVTPPLKRVQNFRPLAVRAPERGFKVSKVMKPRRYQKLCCAICRAKLSASRGVIDQDHKTGKFRSLLSWRCNRRLAEAGDDTDALARLVQHRY
jgi:hypothetical protein